MSDPTSTKGERLPGPRELQALVDEIREQTGVPGIAALIRVGNDQTFASSGEARLNGGRPVGPDSGFEIGCIMKFLLGTSLLKAMPGLGIDLDERVSRYLPELFSRQSAYKDRLRVCHLLAHCGGYLSPDIANLAVRLGMTWERFADFVDDAPPLFEPGTVFNYDHSGFVLVGEIVRRACGSAPLAFVNAQICEPAGAPLAAGDRERAVGHHAMSHHDGSVRPEAITSGVPPFARFWEASLPDLRVSLASLGEIASAIHRTALPGRDGAQPRSLKAALAERLIAIPFVRGQSGSEMTPSSFGPGCAHWRNGLIGNNGSGTGQTVAMRLLPDQDATLLVGVNVWHPFARDTAVDRMLALLQPQSPAGDQADSRDDGFSYKELFDDFRLEELEGDYLGSLHERVRVTGVDSGLELSVGNPGRPAYGVVISEADGRYRMEARERLSVAFRACPVSQRPYLLLGVHAYRRCGWQF